MASLPRKSRLQPCCWQLLEDLAHLAMEAGAFADLEDEPDLYSLSDGEPVLAG